MNILNNNKFYSAYQKMRSVKLNPRRHTAANAYEHSEAAAAMAVKLARLNSLSPRETQLLQNLGRAHDIGKITGNARPERSLLVLADCGVTDPDLLPLVKWHDTGLPWYRSAARDQAPSAKAWHKLASQLELRLLCLFMVADRVDAPAGWKRNAPTTWFLDQARQRFGIDNLQCHVADHASAVSAGGAVVRQTATGPELLLIRIGGQGYELPKGGIEWDEKPVESAIRETREEAGVTGDLVPQGRLGQLEYPVGRAGYLKRVIYYRLLVEGAQPLGPKPRATQQRRWVGQEQVAALPLTSESLRPILQAALA